MAIKQKLNGPSPKFNNQFLKQKVSTVEPDDKAGESMGDYTNNIGNQSLVERTLNELAAGNKN